MATTPVPVTSRDIDLAYDVTPANLREIVDILRAAGADNPHISTGWVDRPTHVLYEDGDYFEHVMPGGVVIIRESGYPRITHYDTRAQMLADYRPVELPRVADQALVDMLTVSPDLTLADATAALTVATT